MNRLGKTTQKSIQYFLIKDENIEEILFLQKQSCGNDRYSDFANHSPSDVHDTFSKRIGDRVVIRGTKNKLGNFQLLQVLDNVSVFHYGNPDDCVW